MWFLRLLLTHYPKYGSKGCHAECMCRNGIVFQSWPYYYAWQHKSTSSLSVVTCHGILFFDISMHVFSFSMKDCIKLLILWRIARHNKVIFLCHHHYHVPCRKALAVMISNGKRSIVAQIMSVFLSWAFGIWLRAIWVFIALSSSGSCLPNISFAITISVYFSA